MRSSFPRRAAPFAIVVGALLAGAPAPASAQDDELGDDGGEREFRFDFGAFAGGNFFTDDHGLGRDKGDSQDLSPADGAIFGARLGLNFNRWVTLEIEGSASPTHTIDGLRDLWVFGYRANLLVHLAESYAFRPFVMVGFGALSSIVNNVPTEKTVPNDTDTELHGGIGFKIGFGDRAGLRVEGRIMAPPAFLAPVAPVGDEINYGGPDFQALGSLYFHFGEVPRSRLVVKKEVMMVPPAPPPSPPTPTDPDGDGISGKADKCPDAPEDRDGFEDEDGCPDPDNDSDAIPDARDKCPGEAEDKDGYQDDDGCPEPDNDGDGAPDAKDKCPNEAEDRDGHQDDDGCPEPDNDGDGILDGRDKCPNQPETANKYQDDDGCPDEIPVEVKKFTGVIEGINFKTNSAEILPGSYAVLDRAVKVLQDFPDVNLEISGHTDSRGRADYNRNLSQRRADAVKQYFSARGVDAKRLISIGYGMDRPIADNTTEAGRAKNRRTEFRLVNPGEK